MILLRRIVFVALALFAILIGLLAIQHLRLSASPVLLAKPEHALRVTSWNVHYIILRRPEGRWGMSGWEARKGPLTRVFAGLNADLVAFQEMESFSRGSDGSVNLARDWLLENNPGYALAASGDWRQFPSTQPILYRPDRLEALDQGFFFFSETPDTIYSRTFNGSYPAFASWVEFRDMRNGGTFRAVNVHFDAFSRENRRRSADLVAARVRPWIEAGEAVVLLGDLNALHGSSLHTRLNAAGLGFPRIPGATFHFDRGLHLFGAIDHIGLSGGIDAAGAPIVIRERGGAVWPTDHYPVVLDIHLAPPGT